MISFTLLFNLEPTKMAVCLPKWLRKSSYLERNCSVVSPEANFSTTQKESTNQLALIKASTIMNLYIKG